MEKYLFIVFAMVLGANVTAQQKIVVYNLSSYNIQISDFGSKNLTQDYPQLIYYTTTPVQINTTDFLEFVNTNDTQFRFPFIDTNEEYTGGNGQPTWYRYTSSTSNPITTSATAATLGYGSTQTFHFIKFSDSFETGLLGVRPSGTSEVVFENITALYEQFDLGPNSTEYTIVFIDN